MVESYEIASLYLPFILLSTLLQFVCISQNSMKWGVIDGVSFKASAIARSFDGWYPDRPFHSTPAMLNSEVHSHIQEVGFDISIPLDLNSEERMWFIDAISYFVEYLRIRAVNYNRWRLWGLKSLPNHGVCPIINIFYLIINRRRLKVSATPSCDLDIMNYATRIPVNPQWTVHIS